MLKSKLVLTLSWSPTFGRGSIIMWRVHFYRYSVMQGQGFPIELFFFCSRPNFLDELARKRLLRRLHTENKRKLQTRELIKALHFPASKIRLH